MLRHEDWPLHAPTYSILLTYCCCCWTFDYSSTLALNDILYTFVSCIPNKWIKCLKTLFRQTGLSSLWEDPVTGSEAVVTWADSSGDLGHKRWDRGAFKSLGFIHLCRLFDATSTFVPWSLFAGILEKLRRATAGRHVCQSLGFGGFVPALGYRWVTRCLQVWRFFQTTLLLN